MERAIAYLRVSTQQQQRSGLGIEAQRAAIERFAAAESLLITAGARQAPAACRGLGCGAEGKVQHRRFEAGSAFPGCCIRLGLNGSTGAVHC